MSAQPNLFGLPMDGLNVFYLAAVVLGYRASLQRGSSGVRRSG
ncbi:MAG: hypothetical protein U5L11_07195 [Arhodomonas sp.]|nr:hypothetical protein [Arhodomonas sp.]